MQPHHVAHARGGGWRCVRKDLLHNPAGNAALLRDLRPLRSIVIVVPRLHLRCCKEVEGGESGCNVVRRDRIRVCLGGRIIWCPFNETDVAAKLLVELAECSEARTCPSVGLGEVVLRREPEVSIGQCSEPGNEFGGCRIEASFARLDEGGDAETPQVMRKLKHALAPLPHSWRPRGEGPGSAYAQNGL